MSIAEKILRAKTDYDEVYEAGKRAAVDGSKVITNTVSGKGLVRLTDVSEMPHKISVKLSSDTVIDFSDIKIKQCWKNLLEVNSYIVGSGQSATIFKGSLTGDFVFSYENNLTDVENYFASMFVLSVNGSSVYVVPNTKVIRISGTLTSISVLNWCSAKGGSIDNIQLERGLNLTEFEAYKEPIELSPNTEGTIEVQSVNPSVTFVSDNEDVALDITYNQSYGVHLNNDRYWRNLTYGITDYAYAFYGNRWNDYNYKPIYPMKLYNVNYMFANSVITQVGYYDEFDFSGFTNNILYMFYKSAVKKIKLMDFTLSKILDSVFRECKSLEAIELLRFSAVNTYQNTFLGCTALENIVVEGEIANSISFSDSNKLTHDTLMSVINALAIVETTKTLTLHADSKALLTDAEKAIATEKGWTIA